METKQETKSIPPVITYIGSIIVIISFFLPWVGSSVDFIGPKFVGKSFTLFKMAEYNSDFFFLGIFLLLLLLSPIICHIIIAIQFYNHRYINKNLAITPLVIWVVEIMIAIIANAGEGEFSLPMGDGFNFGIGAIGTLIGMIITIYVVFSDKVPNSEEIKKGNLIEFKFCPNCGSKLEDNPLFCPECGKHLVKED